MYLQIVGEIRSELAPAQAPIGERIAVPAESSLRVGSEPGPHAVLCHRSPLIAEPCVDSSHLRHRIAQQVVVIEMIDVLRTLATELQWPGEMQRQLQRKALLHVCNARVFVECR